MSAPRVLFVCLGNICRSPTAEGVFRHLAEHAGLDVHADSAGTSGWHSGDPPYAPAVKAAARRGYDLASLASRKFTVADFAAFDLIVGMDDQNIQDIEDLRPPGSVTRVVRMMDFAPSSGSVAVPDPYYSRDFDGALDLIEAASRGLLETLAP